MLGIDYASVAGNDRPDWRTAKKAGVEFTFVRASHALYHRGQRQWHIVPDAHFARDWKKIPVTKGTFMFPEPRAAMPPRDQVQVFHEAVQAQGGLERGVDLPPVLDIEFPGGLNGRTRKQAVEWMLEAADEMVQLFDVHPMLYVSARVWDGEDLDALNADTLMDLTLELKECPLWIPRYPYKQRIKAILKPPIKAPPVPKMWGRGNWWIHQYQGSAKQMPGFTGLVDLNRFNYMKIGEKGERVKWVQRRIGAKDDGSFGPKTQAALVSYQKKNKLGVDGVVGPSTFAALGWEK